MKLLFLVVILALLSSRLVAQVDSNAMISINVSSIGSSCTYTVTERYLKTDSILSTWPASASLSLALKDTFRFNQRPYPDEIGINIDTTAQTIHLVYGLYKNHYEQTGPPGDGIDVLQITFDKIPYTKTSTGVITTAGTYIASWSFNSIRQGSHRPSLFYDGSCGTTGEQSTSVSINLAPPTHSAVKSSADRFDLQHNVIEVYDCVGRIVARTTDRTTLHLPPGCYFARLGEQVAKFVVTE